MSKEIFTIIECEQGTEAWFKSRLGKITASVFDRVVTKTGKKSSSADDIVNRAVAELIMGEPDQTFQSESMLRGQSLEYEALEFFNFTNDYNFKKCGFLDSGKGYGCSPDGIDLGVRKGLELKCPEAHTHLAYLASGELPDKYIQQVQGALMVSGFDVWVFGSYHPSFPCYKIEVKRDEKLIATMREYVEECCEAIREKHSVLSAFLEASGEK